MVYGAVLCTPILFVAGVMALIVDEVVGRHEPDR